MIIAMVLLGVSFVVQFWLKGVYNKWNNVPNAAGMTGEQIARRMLDDAGLRHVPVKMTHGELSDFYDPIKDEVYLSEGNFHTASVAAASVAAHEVGHAIQDKVKMPALEMRIKAAPVLGIVSSVAPIMFMAGVFLQMSNLIGLAVLMFGLGVLFHLVTLPVEFDASRRALAYMNDNRVLSSSEQKAGGQKVLTAAALTYVIAFLSSLAMFMHYLTVFQNSDD